MDGVQFHAALNGKHRSGQRDAHLCPGTASGIARREGKHPPHVGAVTAAEQQPCLHTAQEAAAVLHPVFTGGQAAAVVLHDQVQILVVPGEPDLDLPAGAYGPQGIGKQVEQQLLGYRFRHRAA